MLRPRCCKIGPALLLIFLFSTIYTLIFIYLDPLKVRNEDARSSPSSYVKVGVKPKAQHEIQRVSVVNQDERRQIDSPATGKRNVDGGGRKSSNVEVVSDWNVKLPVLEKQEENLDHAHDTLKFDHDVVSMVGRSPNKPVDIVIGIPTVKRDTMDYLSSTLKHLVMYLNKNETKQCHIVVFSANFEAVENERTAAFLKKHFSKEIDEGLIEVIKPDKKFYSKLTNLPVLWKDKPDRIKWRSKQCLDYALLFAYCRKLGRYYLQLEDDISVSQAYFREMKNFIWAKGPTKWSNLQFGTSGFIGMLFRTSDLGRLAVFVKMYYWIFPVDILFRHFNDVHLFGNSPKDIYRPPLFRHLGHESSLKGQTRRIEGGLKNSRKLVNERRYKNSTNPSAFISTNIEVYEAHTIDGPYRTSNLGYFWGKNIHVNEFILIEFMKELTLHRVVIDTGSQFAPNDIIAGGELETTNAATNGNCNEGEYKLLKSMTSNGKIDASMTAMVQVKCVKLTITKLNLDEKAKSRWLLIKEIAVWST